MYAFFSTIRICTMNLFRHTNLENYKFACQTCILSQIAMNIYAEFVCHKFNDQTGGM